MEDLADIFLDTRGTCLRAADRGGFADPDALARAVHQVAQAPFQRPGRLKEPVHHMAPGTFQDLRDVTAPLKAVDAHST